MARVAAGFSRALWFLGFVDARHAAPANARHPESAAGDEGSLPASNLGPECQRKFAAVDKGSQRAVFSQRRLCFFNFKSQISNLKFLLWWFRQVLGDAAYENYLRSARRDLGVRELAPALQIASMACALQRRPG